MNIHVYMYMCICISMCMYTYMQTYIHIYKFILNVCFHSINAHVQAGRCFPFVDLMQIYMYVYIYIFICIIGTYISTQYMTYVY